MRKGGAARYGAVRDQWEEIDVDRGAFDAFVSDRLTDLLRQRGGPTGDVASAEALLAELDVKALFLVCGCLAGDEAAHREFEREYGRVLRSVARRFGGDADADDLMQLVRERLFFPAGDHPGGRPPKLQAYSGRGSLVAWLRVTALRLCLDSLRKRNRQPTVPLLDDQQLQLLVDHADLELDFLKAEYRQQFKTAFYTALGELLPAERNLLRQVVVHGLTIDQLGALYHVHRSTAARRIEKARERLLGATRSALLGQLKIGTHEFDSIMNLIKSRLDVSLHRLLGQPTLRPHGRREKS